MDRSVMLFRVCLYSRSWVVRASNALQRSGTAKKGDLQKSSPWLEVCGNEISSTNEQGDFDEEAR